MLIPLITRCISAVCVIQAMVYVRHMGCLLLTVHMSDIHSSEDTRHIKVQLNPFSPYKYITDYHRVPKVIHGTQGIHHDMKLDMSQSSYDCKTALYNHIRKKLSFPE